MGRRSASATASSGVIPLPSNVAVNTSSARNCEERALLSDAVQSRTPRRSKWSSLLSRITPDVSTNSPAAAAAAAGVASLAAASDNEVFDVENDSSTEPHDISHALATSNRHPITCRIVEAPEDRVETTHDYRFFDVENDLSTKDVGVTRSSCSSSGTEDLHHDAATSSTLRRRINVVVSRSTDDDDVATAAGLTDLRSELSRQMGAVNERIDELSHRLEVIMQLLANTGPQRSTSESSHPPVDL